jgi:predicted transporter
MMEPTPEMFRSLKHTFQSMTDVQTAVQALQEAEVFRQKLGEFALKWQGGRRLTLRHAHVRVTTTCPCCFSIANFKYIG